MHFALLFQLRRENFNYYKFTKFAYIVYTHTRSGTVCAFVLWFISFDFFVGLLASCCCTQHTLIVRKAFQFFLFLLRCVNDFLCCVCVCAFFKQILIQRVSSAVMLLFLCSFFVGCYDCFDFWYFVTDICTFCDTKHLCSLSLPLNAFSWFGWLIFSMCVCMCNFCFPLFHKDIVCSH